MKDSIILFGASSLGQVAYTALKDQFNVVSFVDNDPQKWGSQFNGIKVISPNQINELKEIPMIIITSSFKNEIAHQLREMGIRHYSFFDYQLTNIALQNSEKYKLKTPILNLGAFLETISPLELEQVTLLRGGSNILDYLFLKGLVIKFNFSTYLEVGTWSGESIALIAAVAKKCYSISLPDEEVSRGFLDFWGKNNFSRYFSKNKGNITHFCENSKSFDYSRISDCIDLVFIDADHSYSGIKSDTKRIFGKIDPEHTIVVWHDFKSKYDEAISTTVDAIYDALPERLHKNIYGVDSNNCGVFLPDKYKRYFDFKNNRNEVYSYGISLKLSKQSLNGDL